MTVTLYTEKKERGSVRMNNQSRETSLSNDSAVGVVFDESEVNFQIFAKMDFVKYFLKFRIHAFLSFPLLSLFLVARFHVIEGASMTVFRPRAACK